MQTKNQLDEETLDWLKLARDSRFSNLQKRKLLQTLGKPSEIYNIEYRDLCIRAGARFSLTRNSDYLKKLGVGIKQDLAWLSQPDCHLVSFDSEDYPALLREISDPPCCLFAQGDLTLLKDPKISVVGSRRPSPSGVKLTETISRDLAKLGVLITSGMALGIDSVAHRAALESGAATLAVMGCGLDIVSPTRHRTLFKQIANKGLLLSEYPIGYPASRYTFPQRNRIVSGLAYGVVIVEAAKKSGTLITARLAMEQNREVFVVPGSPLNPQYTGSHRLIKQGAILTSEANDVLLELDVHLRTALETSIKQAKQINEETSQSMLNYSLLRHISYEPTRVDEIISNSGLTASEVSSMLLILEIEGLVATVDGRYTRI